MGKDQTSPAILLKPHHFIGVRRRRILAFVIDLVPLLLFVLFTGFILSALNQRFPDPGSYLPQPWRSISVSAYIVCLIGYFLFLATQLGTTKSATFGMQILKLKAVTKEGRKPTYYAGIAQMFAFFFCIGLLGSISKLVPEYAEKSILDTSILVALFIGVFIVGTSANRIKMMHKPFPHDFFSKLTVIRTDTKYTDYIT